MSTTKIREDRISADDEAAPAQQSPVSSLVEKLRNRIEKWDTEKMARAIHESAKGYTHRGAKTFKASQ